MATTITSFNFLRCARISVRIIIISARNLNFSVAGIMTSVNSTLPYSLILDEEGILKNTLISSNPAVTTDREEQCNGSDSALTQSNGGSMTETSLSLTHSGILKKPSSGINQSSYATVRLSKVKFTDETSKHY